MATAMWKLSVAQINSKILQITYSQSLRYGHRLRGKPPEIARTLEQRLSELNYKDPELHYRVDIGFPHSSYSRSEQLKKRIEIVKANRQNKGLEMLARNSKLKIDLAEVKKESLKGAGLHQIKEIADHYGVFEHLFGDAYFVPRVPLDIWYECGEKSVPVYYGNIVKPLQANQKPIVNFESDKDSLWTLILTNPDGHFTDQESEYVHWFVANIPGNDISKGEVIIDYLQPFPPKGTGYHRQIFILYKQNKKMDFSLFKKEGSCLTLSERTFKTLDFYREKQDDITPAGLAFFQSNWDSSLTDFFHNTLEMKEPVFEYDFDPPYIKPQKWFPLKEPFNLYMDKYRDPKQVNKEFLVRKLKNVHPFKDPPPPLPYPNAQMFKEYVPSWLQLEITKSRLKWGRINDIE